MDTGQPRSEREMRENGIDAGEALRRMRLARALPEGRMMTNATTINAWLQGSPYLMPVDEPGEARAEALMAALVAIRQRQSAVQQTYEQQAVEIRTELDRDFGARLVFESNAIEGVTSTFEETKSFLSDDRTEFLAAYTFGAGVEADTKLLEVVGHGRALRFVRELADDLGGRPIRESDVRNVHALAMASEPRIAGRYKTTDNRIGGRNSSYLTARSDDVGWHMHQLVDWLAGTSIHGPLVSAVVSAWLADIHPFEDGNGRVSRLLANYVLFRNGWPCLIVRAGPDRERYYDALASSDGGDIGPLFGLFVDGLNRTLSEMEDPDFARTLLRRDLERSDPFEPWRAQLLQFTLQLRHEVEALGLLFDVVGSIGSSDFAWLERRDPAGNGWWAKVRSNRDHDLDLLLWFGYQSDELLASSEPGLKRTPSIFVSERDRSPYALHPYRPLWSDDRLAVREVSLSPHAGRARACVRTSRELSMMEMPVAARTLAAALSGLR